jgi:hypothetical protein
MSITGGALAGAQLRAREETGERMPVEVAAATFEDLFRNRYEPMVRVAGGFNRSSQHLDMEVVGGGGSGASAGGSCIPWSDVVTGSAVDGVA